jgi:hypothetical protein
MLGMWPRCWALDPHIMHVRADEGQTKATFAGQSLIAGTKKTEADAKRPPQSALPCLPRIYLLHFGVSPVGSFASVFFSGRALAGITS